MSWIKHQQSQQKVFTRRLAILGGLKAVMVTAVAGRLYYLQVIEGEKYKLLSDENRISHRILFPPRGLIVDRFGIPLATNSRHPGGGADAEHAGNARMRKAVRMTMDLAFFLRAPRSLGTLASA